MEIVKQYGNWRVTSTVSGRLADRGWTDNVKRPDGFGELYRFPTIEPDKSAHIEHIIPEAYADAIYRSDVIMDWIKEQGREVVDYGGGVKSITVNVIHDIPVNVLTKLRFYDLNGRRRRITDEIAGSIISAFERAMES